MNNYTANSLVSVYPFSRQIEGEDVVIGIPENNLFLVLPTDAVELLDYLTNGKTVGEAKSIYKAKYGEVPYLEELLQGLERRGLVRPVNNGIECSDDTIGQTSFVLKRTKSQKKHYHFANFPQSLAQTIFSRPILISYGFTIGLAIALVIAEPNIIPTWRAYFFQKNASMMILAMMALEVVTLFVHEMAHLVAARSLGVFCRLGIGNRMWTIVAETDMTGIWSVPKNKRYLPFLAGPLLDLVSVAIFTIIFFTHKRGWIAMHPIVFQLGQAWLLNYLLGLLWQCYFFMRTDFYYVFANFFSCKNLLQDTEIFVRNQVSQIVPQIHRNDQFHIPSTERRVIRIYAVLWLLGRTAVIAVLILINLPLMWHYCFSLFTILAAGYPANPDGFIDALFLLALFSVTQGIGLWMWMVSFHRKPTLIKD